MPQLTALRELPGYGAERGTRQSSALSPSREDIAENTQRLEWLEFSGKSIKEERELHRERIPQIFKGSSQEFNRKKKEEWIYK